MTLRAALVGVGLLASTSTIAAKPELPPHVYGEPPSWESFRQIAEAEITRRLIDPESARFSWPYGFYRGEYKPLLDGRVYGYVACGEVNAKNRMGGYTGNAAFIVVIDYDRVLYADLDSRSGGFINNQCLQAAAKGLLPPAPPTTAKSTSREPSGAALTASGLTIRAMPEGAYVSGVTDHSPAALAGLKPGMVIASINGIPLAGMGDAMLKVIDAAGTGATLTVVGGATIKLGGVQ